MTRLAFAAVAFALAACQPAMPPQSEQPASASLCACRALCAPDAYEWTLTYVGPTNGGRCACMGRLDVGRSAP